MALVPLPPPAAAIDLISPVKSASTNTLVALFMRLLLILAVTLKSSLPSPIRLMATAPPTTLPPGLPAMAPARDSILPELEACTTRLEAAPLKVTLSTKAVVLPLSQLVLDEPPALFCALAAMVAEMVWIAAPASAKTETVPVGTSTELTICAERLDSMVLKPKAKATEEPVVDAAAPPANEKILALLAPSPSPACTLMSPAVTVAPLMRASVTSPISFQVAVPVKAN